MPVLEDGPAGNLHPILPDEDPANIELGWILDISGSMTWSNVGPAKETPPYRNDLVRDAAGLFIPAVEGLDSKAAEEQKDGSDELGGLFTVSFSDHAEELGDLNSSNWRHKWDNIRWGGGTRIMPGWELAQREYMEEFGSLPLMRRPNYIGLVTTDGIGPDFGQFGQVLAEAGVGMYFAIVLVGFGEEHDVTLRSYKEIEKKNPEHVRVVTFGSETDPAQISDGLKSLVGIR